MSSVLFAWILTNPDRCVILRGDQVVPMTAKAFDTLVTLIENRSRVVEKDELLKLIWPDTVVEERNVAVNISTLRKVLGDSLESHEYIVTLPGRGYRFVAPVRELHRLAENEKNEAEDRSPDERPTAAQAPLPREQVAAWRRKSLLAVGIILCLIGAFALGRYSVMVRAPSIMPFSTVTNFPGIEIQAAMSPDGRSVAFVSDREGQYDVYVRLLSGGSLVRVTNDPNLEARPRWSPDGAKLCMRG